MGVLRAFGYVTFVLIIAVGLSAGAAPGAGGQSIGPLADTDESAAEDSDDSAPEGPFGQQISSFMQSSAAEASESVETGMWNVRAERAGPENIEHRANGLDQRLERLAAELEELDETSEDDHVHQARKARLLGQYMGLLNALDNANHLAERAGVDPPGLKRANERVGDIDSEIRGEARGLSGGEPPGLADRTPPGHADNGPGGGPPDDAPGQSDSPGGGPPDDAPGQSDSPGDGPPDDAPGQSGSDNRGGSSGGGGGGGSGSGGGQS